MHEPTLMTQRDPLLEALATIIRLHHRPHSGESLVAGLPLDNGRLTPPLFIRAAAAAGFEASFVQHDIIEINDLILPVVLTLNKDRACILEAINDGEASVIFIDDQETKHTLPLDSLQERYAGYCFLIKPVATTANLGSKEWFWSTIERSKSLYMEVLVASLLINLFALVTPLFIMNVYDRVVSNHAVETLWVLASGVGIVFLFDLAMKSLRGFFIDAASKRADIMLSARTFSRVMDIKMSDRPPRVGSFANNLQEFDSFREFLPRQRSLH